MTTSGVTTSTMLVSEVVRAAMEELGVLSAGEQPEAAELTLGIRSLNWMLKSFQALGYTSWRDATGTATFGAGVSEVQLAADCLDVTSARFVMSSSYERPLQRWELGRYRDLPNKAQRGYPSGYAIEKTAGAVSMLLWPVPNASVTINYSYARIVEDVTDGSQTIDIPQEWLETVYIALAARLAQTFGVTRTDPNTAAALAKRAAGMEQLLLDSDRSSSVYMGSTLSHYG